VLPLISSGVRVSAVTIFESAVAASHYLAPERSLAGRRAEEHQTRVYGAIGRCARAILFRGVRLVRIGIYRPHASRKAPAGLANLQAYDEMEVGEALLTQSMSTQQGPFY